MEWDIATTTTLPSLARQAYVQCPGRSDRPGHFSRLPLPFPRSVRIIKESSVAGRGHGRNVHNIPPQRQSVPSRSASVACPNSPPGVSFEVVSHSLRPAPVIGLIGGIGSGKSFLAQALQEKYNLKIVNGDEAGHVVLNEEAIKAQLRSRFGDDVFAADGHVDRRKMSQHVFGSDSAAMQARADLEAIVHPRIKQILSEQIAAARADAATKAVVLDAALLLEAGWHNMCNCVIFVETTFEQRLDRVQKHRGWSREDLLRREASQWPLDVKRKEAQHVVDNTGDPTTAVAQLDRIFSEVIPSASHPSRVSS